MSLRVAVSFERWALREPFEIAREVMHELPLIHLTLSDRAGFVGQAEAAGVDYDGETPQSMAAQIEAVAAQLDDDIDGQALYTLLPPGGARNALDCACWDLQAKRSGQSAWRMAGLAPMRPLVTASTIGLGSLDDVKRRARAAMGLPLIKVKVDSTRHVEPLRIVRDTLPATRIVVDANQSWSIALLDRLMPDLQALGVELIEQPLPRGGDEGLADFASPIALAADESCTDTASLDALRGRYRAVNIKLDKCGGLTEALRMAQQATDMGFDLMVGNMCGSSLGMAPAFLVAQQARWADLDGPLLQRGDRAHPMTYHDGVVQPPTSALWG